jgi:hypothetical protein
MIFDKVVADQSLTADVLKVASFGKLVILSTHVQEDQIVPRTVIPTGAAV